MQVNKSNGDVPRIETPSVRPSTAPAVSDVPVESAAPIRRVDEVEISTAGRVLAGDQPPDPALDVGLEADRVSELRGRVVSGSYLTLDVAESTARSILQSGDL
jgi:hypothetical protein